MRISRIYCDENIHCGQKIFLKEDIAYRLMHVMRVKPGYKINLFNGRGLEFTCEVIACSRHAVEVLIQDQIKTDALSESQLKINLVQGISKTDKMDFALQKACELGVYEITPLITKYTQLKKKESVYESKISHWQKVVIHAAEQSGRSELPKLNPITPLMECINDFEPASTFFLSPRGAFSFDKTANTAPSQKVHVLIGGEGGFSQDEEDLLHKRGFKGIKLGPRVLRTETASVVALTLLQYFWGDLRL